MVEVEGFDGLKGHRMRQSLGAVKFQVLGPVGSWLDLAAV